MKTQWKLRKPAKKKMLVLKRKREEKTCRCGNGGMTEVIQKQGIRWHISPVTTDRECGAHPVGFYLELFGTHCHPECLPANDCPECQAVIRGLNQLLDELLPQQPQEKSDFLTVCRPSIGYSSRTGFRIEAVISVMIPDDKQGQRPVDPVLMDTLSCLATNVTRLTQPDHERMDSKA